MIKPPVDGDTHYIRAMGMELSVIIERNNETDLRPKCDLCGAVEHDEELDITGSWIVEVRLGSLERAEYWLGKVPDKMKFKILRGIQQALAHKKALCELCYHRTWMAFEQKFGALSLSCPE